MRQVQFFKTVCCIYLNKAFKLTIHCPLNVHQKCFGCKSYSQNLCLVVDCLCCKTYSDHEVCCILNRNNSKCVGCSQGLCNCYQQCCCTECVFSLCCNVQKIYEKAPSGTEVDKNKVGQPHPVDVTACAALCCTYSGCYWSVPECLGCSGNGSLCCLENTGIWYVYVL